MKAKYFEEKTPLEDWLNLVSCLFHYNFHSISFIQTYESKRTMLNVDTAKYKYYTSIQLYMYIHGVMVSITIVAYCTEN